MTLPPASADAPSGNGGGDSRSPAGSVIAIVKGGLGNQLFVYAAARALALRTNRDLLLDTHRGYTNDTYGRSYRLDRFPIRAEPMPEEWRIAPTLKHPLHKLKRAWNKLLSRDRRSYLAEHHQQDESQLTALQPKADRITLLGYWQSEAYFADRAEVIRRELRPPAPTDARNLQLAKEMENSDSVFLHVRRVRYDPRLASDYYQAAIRHIRQCFPNARFYLFGDDLAWPRSQLDFGGSEVVEVNHNSDNELADLWLMSRCRHAIAANSSFSWWGAWLGNPSSDREVCFPESPGLPLRAAHGWQRVPNSLEPAGR